MKTIVVSVTNDLVADNRVNKVCVTLFEMGFKVILVGRLNKDKRMLSVRPYATNRFRLLFNKGPFFYANYNIRLFFFLLFHKVDILLSNDLDTLPANYLVSRIKRVPLVYDSHEYFTQVPELVARPAVQRIWERIEGMMVPGVTKAYTVCESIANVYFEKYRIPFKVVRNLPNAYIPEKRVSDNNVEGNKRTIIYQGALNAARGLESAIAAMQYLEEATLVIAGSGDIEGKLRELAKNLGLGNVVFAGRLPLEELASLTQQCHVGISIEEDFGLNYRYALPNKLFDYIQARIPVIVSNLPEMTSLIEHYKIGLVTPSHEPRMLAFVFREALFNDQLRHEWRNRLEHAAHDLTWENEKKVIGDIFSSL